MIQKTFTILPNVTENSTKIRSNMFPDGQTDKQTNYSDGITFAVGECSWISWLLNVMDELFWNLSKTNWHHSELTDARYCRGEQYCLAWNLLYDFSLLSNVFYVYTIFVFAVIVYRISGRE